MAVTLATNKKDELALVKLYSKGIEIKGDKRFRSFKPYLYISDNENKPIKISKKFKLLKNKIMKKRWLNKLLKKRITTTKKIETIKRQIKDSLENLKNVNKKKRGSYLLLTSHEPAKIQDPTKQSSQDSIY